METEILSNSLNCNGCTACCLFTPSLILHPEKGDDPSLYETVEVGGQTRIKPREDGEMGCRYRIPGVGCEVYENRPYSCRRLDCREWYKAATDGLNRKERRKLEASVPRCKAIFPIARKKIEESNG